MGIDIGIDVGTQWFRARAAALIIFNQKILMVKNDRDPFYYTVGGGIHFNESSEVAVKREVKEEIGVDLEIDHLAYIHENFFSGNGVLRNKTCHQIEFYYVMKCKEKDIEKIMEGSKTTDQVEEHLYWLDVSKLNEYLLYPVFLKDKINNLLDSIEHLITFD